MTETQKIDSGKVWAKFEKPVVFLGTWAWLLTVIPIVVYYIIGLDSLLLLGGIRNVVISFFIVAAVMEIFAIYQLVSKKIKERDWDAFNNDYIVFINLRIPKLLIMAVLLTIFSAGWGGLFVLLPTLMITLFGPIPMQWIHNTEEAAKNREAWERRQAERQAKRDAKAAAKTAGVTTTAEMSLTEDRVEAEAPSEVSTQKRAIPEPVVAKKAPEPKPEPKPEPNSESNSEPKLVPKLDEDIEAESPDLVPNESSEEEGSNDAEIESSSIETKPKKATAKKTSAKKSTKSTSSAKKSSAKKTSTA